MAELVVRPSRLPSPGGEAPATFLARAGGQALNVARTVRNLGGRASLCASIGQDEWGRWLSREVRRLGIRPLLQPVREPTGMVISIAAAGQRTMYAQRGANARLSLAGIRLSGANTLYVSGYLLGNAKADQEVPRLLDQAHARGVASAVDTPPADILDTLGAKRFLAAYSKAGVLFTTQDEASVLTDKPASKAAAAALAGRFRLVVIKQGAQGCWVQQGDAGSHVPTVPLDPVDATGAGDAFCAGFLHAQIQGKQPLEAAAFAHRVAAQTIAGATEP